MSIQDLINRAEAVRTTNVEDFNTAERIGGLMKDIVIQMDPDAMVQSAEAAAELATAKAEEALTSANDAIAAKDTALANNELLGGIAYNASAPTPGKSGKYSFTTGGSCTWLTGGAATVAVGDEVVVVYTAPSTYTYTKVGRPDIEETRSQSTSKVPSSKLVDDELNLLILKENGLIYIHQNQVFSTIDINSSFSTTDGYFIFWAIPPQNSISLNSGDYFVYLDFEVISKVNIDECLIYPTIWHSYQNHSLGEDKFIGYNGQSGSLKCWSKITLLQDKPENRLGFYITSVLPNSGNHTIEIKVNKAYIISISNNVYEPLIRLINSLSQSKELYTYNQDSDYYKEINNTQIIDCFGDSHIGGGYGAGINSMPYYLQNLIGNRHTVNNYGNGGENILDIAARNGSLPAIIDPFNFIQGGGAVPVTIRSYNGDSLSYRFAVLWSGLGYPVIGGVSCAITNIDGNFFVQTQSGASLTTTRPETVISLFMQYYNSKNVMIICAGANGGWDDIEDLAQLSKQLSHQNKKHIICSIPSNSFGAYTRNDYNKRMIQLIGINYLNVHNYVMTYGLADNGLTPTLQDLDAIASGNTPPQLMYDEVHYNNFGLIAFANIVYKKGKDLGYWF